MNKNELHDFITERQPNICQITAIKDGREVYSDTWNDYTESDCVHVMSVTKSVMALLIGIALDKGQIGGVNDKVLDYFPEYKVKRGEKTIYDVTIKHLLTMRAPYKGKGDPWSKVCSSENWTYTSLDFLGGRKGLNDQFCYSKIYTAKSAEEHREFTISKLPKENVWFSDRQGLGTPGYGLCFCARDMARLGLLCLNKGMYEGKRIVSQAWIEEMTNARKVEGKHFRGMDYGYLWWIVDSDKKIYAAIGNSGNVIYVNPEKNLVVAVASYFKPTIFDRVDFIRDHIEPFVEELFFCSKSDRI